MSFCVYFKFDYENSESFIIESEDKEVLFKRLVRHTEWFKHENNKKVVHAINMKIVTSISIGI